MALAFGDLVQLRHPGRGDGEGGGRCIDAPPNPAQLDAAETVAKASFPLGERLDETPWMGVRPCTPDMKPIIGPEGRNGLWLAIGHAHHGLTLGPATGRLLAEMMMGETPFVDPAPYSIKRFG